MFYLQTLFFQLWKFGIPPTQVKPSKTNKKKKFHFFPPRDTYFLSSGKKRKCSENKFCQDNLSKFCIFSEKHGFLSQNETKISFLTCIKLICKQNVEMITGIIFFSHVKLSEKSFGWSKKVKNNEIKILEVLFSKDLG